MNKALIAFLIICSTNLFAQDKLAKDLIDKLSETTKSYKNMIVSFDFVFENKKMGINEKQKGVLELQKEMFRLEMEGQTIINDGENQWIYLADVNEVQIMEHDPEDQMMSPNKLFTIYEEGYKYNYVGSKIEKGKDLQIIDLFPEQSGAFMKISLEINANRNQLHKITIHDKNGGTYSYLISSFKSNTVLAPITFNSDYYKDVEIIDLR